jgi:hypothetical protein
MKTYQQFILEAKQPKPDALETIVKNTTRATPDIKFVAHTTFNNDDIRVDNMEVPKDQRNKKRFYRGTAGVGSARLRGVTKYADRVGKRVSLTPVAKRGYKHKLTNWYKKFGFKSNKGRNKDFSVSDTMIRNPKS